MQKLFFAPHTLKFYCSIDEHSTINSSKLIITFLIYVVVTSSASTDGMNGLVPMPRGEKRVK